MAEPTLDGLPTELKILILFQVGNVDTLKSLVFASPGYHQAYLVVRHELLACLVKRQYGGFLDMAEALTAIRSKDIYFGLQTGNAICLLDSWRRRDEIRSHASPNLIDEPNGLEEVIQLLHFHRMLCFFLEDYSINAPRPPWIEPAQWESEFLPLDLSPCEKGRFLRAMCRFQLVKNLFGDPVYCEDYGTCDSCAKRNTWQLGEIGELKGTESIRPTWQIREQAYRLFYGTIPPWEHEEMGGVFNYLMAKIETIYKEIAHDLRQLSKSTPCEFFWDILPKEQRPPSVSEIESERDLVHFPQHFDGLAGLGPEFVYRTLRKDRLSRRNILCLNIRGFWAGPFVGLKIGISWDEKFPFTDPADQHEMPNFEQFWSTLSPLERPTLGWKKAWLLPHNEHDMLEDCMNFERKTETDWEWGYALWDDRRLMEWKAPLLENGQV
ncbi:hypothetical protein ASPWEDRAFT_27365 [Aspergillus wentii DTO 134E9]|uniref:Uncharacterized protein n=1 Tax=Aspergillus wentii DTO 134E9 TaxID=1073089 RepID=A0A1L9RIB7_ASPWE|nr:uncharacterized protein ASPWEDRAFT_27365 [Aspergillus wentii DTO 134E9]KAI9932370.1 hypothetical protein MW887_009883 [Aspergillus wentii]OJJ34664.1 hypothetical protein ASPWEDRAFT_27365 [Aspergillus wentii DTO 134E9]